MRFAIRLKILPIKDRPWAVYLCISCFLLKEGHYCLRVFQKLFSFKKESSSKSRVVLDKEVRYYQLLHANLGYTI